MCLHAHPGCQTQQKTAPDPASRGVPSEANKDPLSPACIQGVRGGNTMPAVERNHDTNCMQLPTHFTCACRCRLANSLVWSGLAWPLFILWASFAFPPPACSPGLSDQSRNDTTAKGIQTRQRPREPTRLDVSRDSARERTQSVRGARVLRLSIGSL